MLPALCPPSPLHPLQRAFRNVTASDDPILRKLAKDGAAHVFVTDSVLSAIMCAKSSVYSWDVVFSREGDSLFIDKRDGGPLDLLTVNETAPDQVGGAGAAGTLHSVARGVSC